MGHSIDQILTYKGHRSYPVIRITRKLLYCTGLQIHAVQGL